jgi:hypothetical protein
MFVLTSGRARSSFGERRPQFHMKELKAQKIINPMCEDEWLNFKNL